MELKGKRAFITAAGQGIGRATAEAMTRAGAHVVATDLKPELMAGLDAAETAGLDVLDKAALTQAIHDAKPDILVNCAGFVHAGSVLEASDDDFDFAMTLNVRSQMHSMQAALPGMLERGWGAIVNIASVASSMKGVPNRCVYATSKAAIIGLTKSVAADYVTQGITCNAICPGTVDSPSLHDRLRATGNYDQAMKDFVARQPMGRLGRADEIADLAIYLSSDSARYLTGQAIAIDGGWAL